MAKNDFDIIDIKRGRRPDDAQGRRSVRSENSQGNVGQRRQPLVRPGGNMIRNPRNVSSMQRKANPTENKTKDSQNNDDKKKKSKKTRYVKAGIIAALTIAIILYVKWPAIQEAMIKELHSNVHAFDAKLEEYIDAKYLHADQNDASSVDDKQSSGSKTNSSKIEIEEVSSLDEIKPTFRKSGNYIYIDEVSLMQIAGLALRDVESFYKSMQAPNLAYEITNEGKLQLTKNKEGFYPSWMNESYYVAKAFAESSGRINIKTPLI